MTMYAEERQQAMAQLVTERGRVSVERDRRAVRRHHRDRPPRPVGPRADRPAPPGARRRRPGRRRSRSSRPGSASATRPTPPRRTGSPRAALDLLPPPTAPCSSTPAPPPAGSPACSPATTGSPSSRTRCRSRPGWPGSRPGRAAPAPRPGPADDPGRGRRRHRRGAAPAARRRRVPRHQRAQPRPRALHPRPRGGGDQAGHGRRRAGASSCLADSSKVGTESPVRFAELDEVDVLVTDDGIAAADRRALGARGRRGRGRVIVTLTANPSHDRTVALAGPLERGAVIRADSVISQAGGKGVNISRASVIAGVPSIAVLPAPPDDPFVHELLAAGIDCRPVPTDGALRVNITISEPDGTTTKLNSPGPTVTADVLTALADSLRRRAAGAAWVVLAGSLPPGAPVGWYADLVAALRDDRHPDRRRHQRRAAAGPGRRARPRGTAPDEAERRGARVVHRRRPGRARVRPAVAAARPPHPGRPRRRDRARDARRRTAPYSSPPTAPGTPLPRRRPWSARSARATPASSATCSADLRGQGPDRPTRARRRLRQRGRRTPRHDHPATPPGPTPSSSRSAASTSPREGDHVRSHQRQPGAPRRRPRHRQARRDPGARPGGRRGRSRDQTPTSSSRTPSPASRSPAPACPAASPSRTAAPAASRRRRSRSPGSPRRSTSAPRTARPTWSS